MLKTAREEAKVSARELARRLGITHPTIGRWESGETVPNAEDVSAYLACLSVVGEERERILTLARGSDEDDWLAAGPPGISPQLAGVMDCERTAIHITEWAPLGIPGVMQTNHYARTIIGTDEVPRAEIETRVMARLARRDVITRGDPVKFASLIGEPAVHARVGGPAVMVDQLKQVLDLSKRDNVTVQVVSVTGDWHPGNMGPFIIYEFENRPSIVYLEHFRSGAFLVEQEHVDAYKAAVEVIRRAAMSAEQSAALIADVISTLETTI